MPSGSSLLTFAAIVALVTITPGLDTALVLRSALSRGRAHAAATAAGVSLGVLVWAVAAATGVSALLAASETGYAALRFCGAAYMIVLGGRLLRDAVRRRSPAHDASAVRDARSRWDGLRAGFFTNLLNPKVGAFYVALLPQFVPDDGSALLSGVVLGLVHCAQGVLWFGLLILGADAARRFLTSRDTERWIEGITGTALVGFGVQLARSPAK